MRGRDRIDWERIKEFTYIEQPGGDHNLSTNAQRIETLTAIEAFLAEHLN